MLEQFPDILTIKQCQGILSIGKNLMLDLVHSGTIPAFRLGSHWRISKQSLIKFIETPNVSKIENVVENNYKQKGR